MRIISIYGLVDPFKPDELRVVGKTSQKLNDRLHGYINEARRKKRLSRHLMPSLAWVIDLLEHGRKPSIHLLCTSSKATWKQDEKQVLNFYRQDGHTLLNVRAGGDGPEDGLVKEFCGTCGAKRKQYPGRGTWYCPKCKLAWQKTETGRMSSRRKSKRSRERHPEETLKRNKEAQTKLRKEDHERWLSYRNNEKSRATNRHRAHTPEFRKKAAERARAKRRGLTVAQYRAQVQI